MSQQATVFTIGDWIVHANYGVGQVVGKDKKALAGEEKTYLKVKTSSSLYWLPITSMGADHIRPLASPHQIQTALSILSTPPEPLEKEHKQRSKDIAQLLDNATYSEVAYVLRDINGLKKEGRLNKYDSDVYEKLISQFVDEWAIIDNIDHSQAVLKINKALSLSLLHAPLEKEVE